MATKTDEQRAAEWEARIELGDTVTQLCRRFDLDPNYVYRLDITPGDVTVELFKGREGRCQGPKYIDPDTGDVAYETLTFKVKMGNRANDA